MFKATLSLPVVNWPSSTPGIDAERTTHTRCNKLPDKRLTPRCSVQTLRVLWTTRNPHPVGNWSQMSPWLEQGQARQSRWPHIWRQDVTNQQKDHERPIWCHQSSLHSVSDPVQVRSSPCPKITRKHRKWSVIFRPWGVHTGRICLNWVVTRVPSHFTSASGSNFPPKLGQLVAKVL